MITASYNCYRYRFGQLCISCTKSSVCQNLFSPSIFQHDEHLILRQLYRGGWLRRLLTCSMSRTTSSELDEFLRPPTVHEDQGPTCMLAKQLPYLSNVASNGTRLSLCPRFATLEASSNWSVLIISTAVERVFSQGRQPLHFTRNRLAPSTIRDFLGLEARGSVLEMKDLLASVENQKQKRNEVKYKKGKEE